MASARPFRFGAYEFDASAGELRKGRTRLRVPDQSLAILALLLERPGEMVTREEIQAKLWPHGTVVEFEHSVNSAVKRLREALSDTAATPRYVETLPRKGYRFIGTLAAVEEGPGAAISHYRILAEAGRGAMGVIYKAEDTTLGRMVALKFLPEELASHPPALERLRREARMIGALNHPGICTVHELGEAQGRVFLVMEYLEGETLRERMARGSLSKTQFFDIAIQVAKALEAAHAQGMVHRDIKPDNLFLTKQGVVKMLDFGLAKPVEEEGGATAQSSVTGTSGYMSPEQARGEPLDARSDIYSLGRVLAELRAESLPAVRKAMEADPAQRWQSAGALRVALEQAQRKKWPSLALWSGLAVAVTAAAWMVVWLRGAKPSDDLRPVPLVAMPGVASMPSLSSDGSRVAFLYRAPRESSHSGTDKCGIYVVQVGGGPPVQLTHGEVDGAPAWSPDGSKIAFLRPDTGVMLTQAIGGGSPRELTRMDVDYGSILWTPDAQWLILSARESEKEPYGLWSVSTGTEERRRVLPLPEVTESAAFSGDFAGSLSADGRVLVFARGPGTLALKPYAVRLTRQLKPEGPPRELTSQTYGAIRGMAWAGARDIVFGGPLAASGGLFRVPVSGGASPRRLSWAAPGAGWPTVAQPQNRLVYTQNRNAKNLWRMDLRTGEFRVLAGSSYLNELPQYSPDGRQIAFDSDRSGTWGVWTCDADGENCQQRTAFTAGVGGTPRWSPDSRWLAIDSREQGKSQIYVMKADGGPLRQLTSGHADSQVPSWSRDGRWIYFCSDRSGQWRVWKAPSAGGEAVQVTHTGAGASFESADGKYLYFISTNGNPSPLMRMPVGGGEEKAVVPRVIFWYSFCVTAKGVYFLSDPQTLQLLDERTGRIRTVARLEKHAASYITVSPDDASLVFVQRDERGDLMLVEGFR